MSIGFDSSALVSGLVAGSPQVVTFNHTCSGRDRLLVLSYECEGLTPICLINAASYNGVALTKYVVVDNTISVRSEIWYLINPPAGTFVVSVTLLGSTGGTSATLVTTSFIGVSQSAPADSSATNFAVSANPSLSITTGVANALVIGVLSGQHSRVKTPPGSMIAVTNGIAYDIINGAAGVTAFAWIMLSDGWTYALASFVPSPSSFMGINEVDG